MAEKINTVIKSENLIEYMLEDMYVLCDRDRFGKLGGNWGYKSSELFLDRKLQFLQASRDLAKSVHVLYGEGKFYAFNGMMYEVIDEVVLKQAYLRLLERFNVIMMLNDQKAFNDYFLDVIKMYNPLEQKFDVVAFKNGVLDVGSGVFHKHNPKYHCTYYHNYNYQPKADCPMWKDFLREVLPDRNARLTLQMYMGLGLIERNTVYTQEEAENGGSVELCLLLIGGGSNGKSVVFNTAMGVFGSRRISGVDYEDLVSEGDEGMRARSLMRGKIFNWCSDASPRQFGRKTDKFKRIVSGEPITDRKIGGNVAENYQCPYLIFNLNDIPLTDDKSYGFIRRLQYIPFNVTIPREKQNTALSFELQKEYPGIFNWVMRGCRAIKNRGFQFPDSDGQRRYLLLTKLNACPVLAWVDAYGIRAKGKTSEPYLELDTKEICRLVTRFAQDNGYYDDVHANGIGRALTGKVGTEGVVFYKKHTAEGNFYRFYGVTREYLEQPIHLLTDEMPEVENVRNLCFDDDD